MTNQEAIKYLIVPIATSTMPSAGYLVQRKAYDLAIKALEEARPHGKWIRKVDKVGFVSHICSECGAEIELEDCSDNKFCFNCGASMQKGGKEE